MNPISSRQNAIGPIATSMNGRRRPSGVWNESLQGPTIGETVSANRPSAPIATPISVPESVNVRSSGGSATEMVVTEKASPNAPSPSDQIRLRRTGGALTSACDPDVVATTGSQALVSRSEEHTSELQS